MTRFSRLSVPILASAILAVAAIAGGPAYADGRGSAEVDPLPPPSYAVASTSPDWVLTPAGLAYKSCVHHVPDGASVSANGDVLVNGVVVDTIPDCPYSGMVAVPVAASPEQSRASSAIRPPVPAPDGWWLDSWWTSSSQIVSLTARWTVPPNPTSNGATIFLFPSIEPAANGGGIVQPVLQWGVSAAGGGNYWRMANWFVPGSGSAVFGTLHTVTAGQAITGTLTRSSGTSAVWNVGFTLPSGTSTTLVTNTGVTSWKAVQGGVLEVYGATSCAKLPNTTSVKFSSIAVRSSSGAVTPSWTNNRRVTSCSSSISSSSTTTTLGWRTS